MSSAASLSSSRWSRAFLVGVLVVFSSTLYDSTNAFSPSVSSIGRAWHGRVGGSVLFSFAATTTSHDDDHDDDDDASLRDRRRLLRDAARVASAVAVLSVPTVGWATAANPVPLRASWRATTGLNTSSSDDGKKEVVRFDPSAYAAMRDDKLRTPVFKKAVAARIRAVRATTASSSPVVAVDVGTGPFALFAVAAAEAGADTVYALEADPAAAASAREIVKKRKLDGVIEVVEGPSSDFSLSEDHKADLIVAEVIGSVASEEGAFATIVDAGRRLLKRPDDRGAYVPCRANTYAAPASYVLHNLFGPPGFDWTKLDGEPVRFNCRDEGLQLLDAPQVVEELDFCGEATKPPSEGENGGVRRLRRTLDFTVDPVRVERNRGVFQKQLVDNGVSADEATPLAERCAGSCSGVALWPAIVVYDDGSGDVEDYTIRARAFPDGGHRRSHWQTVLPIGAARPVGPLEGGETIRVEADFALPTRSDRPPEYKLEGVVNVSPTASWRTTLSPPPPTT